jgi:hypothetical protein
MEVRLAMQWSTRLAAVHARRRLDIHTTTDNEVTLRHVLHSLQWQAA